MIVKTSDKSSYKKLRCFSRKEQRLDVKYWFIIIVDIENIIVIYIAKWIEC